MIWEIHFVHSEICSMECNFQQTRTLTALPVNPAFLVAELPSQLISKPLGPDVWVNTYHSSSDGILLTALQIPCQTAAWPLVSAYQFCLSGRTSFVICRVVIGTLQSGFIPDLILYMSCFFTGKELPFRLALFQRESDTLQ